MWESKKWFSKKTTLSAKQQGKWYILQMTFHLLFYFSHIQFCFENWCFRFLVHHQQNVVFKRWKNPVTLPLWIAMLIRKLRVRRKLLKQAKHALHSVAQWVEITSNIAFIEFLSFIHNLAIILKGQIRKIK